MPEGNFEINKSHLEPEGGLGSEKKVENEPKGTIRQTLERFREISKSFCEAAPQNRNFNIELQETKKGVNLLLRHKESGKEKDLSMFLPPEHFFAQDETFVYHRRDKKISFPEGELGFRGFLLSLFHEIGHSHEKQEHSITNWDTLKALLEGVSVLIKSIRVQKKEQEGERGKKTIYKITSLPAKALLPQWYVDKVSLRTARSERGAWAYALRSLRRLKEEGYDVFAGYEDVDQIRAYVAYCLYTYDMDFFMKKLMSGDLRGAQKLSEKPLFLKRNKAYGIIMDQIIISDKASKESKEDRS